MKRSLCNQLYVVEVVKVDVIKCKDDVIRSKLSPKLETLISTHLFISCVYFVHSSFVTPSLPMIATARYNSSVGFGVTRLPDDTECNKMCMKEWYRGTLVHWYSAPDLLRGCWVQG